MAQIIAADPFTQAINFVFAEEGGYSVDPVPTNKGIEQEEYDLYRAGKGNPEQTIKAITIAEATEIYTDNYWKPAKVVAGTHDLVSIFCFDTMVNMGISGGTKIVQQAVSTFRDGVWGPHSQAVMETYITAHSELSLVVLCGNIRRDHYRAIVNHYGQDRQYLADWLGRTDRLEVLLAARHVSRATGGK